MAKKKYYLQTPAKENARYICKPPVHLSKHANTEFDSQHSFGKSTLQRLLFFPFLLIPPFSSHFFGNSTRI